VEKVKEIIQIENHSLEIKRRARQRRMVLVVKPDGGLRVTCGRGVPKRDILEFIGASHEFIAQNTLRHEAQRQRYPAKEFSSGEDFMFLGRTLPLEIIWGWQRRIQVEPLEDSLEMRAPLASRKEERAKALRQFYRKQAELHLPEEVAACAKVMDLYPKKLSIRGQITRWGSCSSTGMVSLNWKLMAAPVDVIRYVVVHELAHLRHPNHSARFWDLVERHHPDCHEPRRWLRENEFQIFQQFKI
jgi:predicted metal-dependent hydrolase